LETGRIGHARALDLAPAQRGPNANAHQSLRQEL
jgi:hypothetical protein